MNKKIKSICAVGAAALVMASIFIGCSNAKQSNEAPETTSSAISVVSREDGSGTRGAFIELFGIQTKDADGNKVDNTIESAEITNSTSVMMTTIAGNKAAIGYISMGSLNDTVKALQVDGVDATVENVKNGTYKISRPFNIATKGEVSEISQDFINYIMSDDGQAIVEENGYVSEGGNGAFSSNGASGKIKVAGSSSVTPVMEKLKEAYMKVNTGAEIDIQQHDSTTGMSSTIEGLCDIGMASRELEQSEVDAGLKSTAIALDGVAVIVNNESDRTNISSEDVRKIYTGEIATWEEVSK